MIFPGMDPYLEDPQLWTGVHARMIVYICDHLQPLLRPRYVGAIEERVYVEGIETQRIPDVWIKRTRRHKKNGALAVLDRDEPIVVKAPREEIHESYVAILDTLSRQKLVTLIELVSPSNKRPGPGRDSYVAKQTEVMGSTAHLVEIDLLRTGQHVLAVPERAVQERVSEYEYLACVNRAKGERDEFDLYPRKLAERLPRIRIPLSGKDKDVILDLQAVFAQTYEAASYDVRIRYDKPCVPALSKENQAWANQVIRRARLRRERRR